MTETDIMLIIIVIVISFMVIMLLVNNYLSDEVGISQKDFEKLKEQYIYIAIENYGFKSIARLDKKHKFLFFISTYQISNYKDRCEKYIDGEIMLELDENKMEFDTNSYIDGIIYAVDTQEDIDKIEQILKKYNKNINLDNEREKLDMILKGRDIKTIDKVSQPVEFTKIS